MTRDAITALFASYHDAMARHDAAAVAAHHAENGILESPWAGVVTGRAAIEDVHRTWFAAFSDAKFESRELVIDGNRVAWLMHVAATHRGGFMGLPPTHQPFHFPVVLLCTVENGEIVHDRRVYDFSGHLIQIGVLKAKPR